MPILRSERDDAGTQSKAGDGHLRGISGDAMSEAMSDAASGDDGAPGMSLFEAYEMASSGRRQRRRKADEPAEEGRTKERVKVRELQQTPEVGYHYRQKTVGILVSHSPAVYLPVLRLLRTPWASRAHLGRSISGPHGCAEYANYVDNQAKMLAFAERFAVPFSVDSADAQPYDSKLLHFAMLTHAETHLFVPRVGEVRKVVFPQHAGDITSSLMLNGDEGGYCGIPDFTVFFMLRKESRSTPKALLQLVTALSMGLNMNYFGESKASAAFNTNFCEVFKSKNRVDSARLVTSSNLRARTRSMQYNMHEELDDELLTRLYEELGEGSWNDVVAKCRQVVNSIYGEPCRAADELPNHLDVSGLFECFMRVDVVAARDARTDKPQAIKVDAVYIRSKIPGADPLMAVQNLWKNVPEVKKVLLDVLKHMSLVLHGHADVGVDELFTVGSGAVDVVEMTHEGNLPLAVALFAQREGWSAEHGLGGQTIDVDDAEEVRVYKHMLSVTSGARRKHFQTVLHQTQNDIKGSKSAAERPDTEYTVDGPVNFHFRSMPLSELRAEIEEIRKDLKDPNDGDYEQWSSEFVAEWEEWIKQQLISDDRRTVYFMGAGGLFNSGALLHLELGGFHTPSFDELKRQEGLKHVMPQPAKASRAVALFLSAKVPQQKYRFVWEDQMLPCLWYMESARDKLRVELVELCLAMGRQLTLEELSKLHEGHDKDREVLQQWGYHRNDLLETLDSVCKRSVLTKTGKLYNATFFSEIGRVMEELPVSRIRQLEMLGLMLVDLHSQEERFKDVYVEQTQALLAGHCATAQCGSDVSEEAVTALFVQMETRALKLKVSFCNEINTQAVQCANAAIFGYMPNNRVYGYCLHISDGGRSFHVLGVPKNVAKKKRTRVLITKKSAGTGGDLAVEQEVMRASAYTDFVCDDKEVKDLYAMVMARDVTQKRTTQMALTEWLGCGLKQDSEGKIDLESTPFLQLAGVSGVFTELLKFSTDVEMMKQMETLMGHSSRGQYLRETGWLTTKNMRQQNTTPVEVLPVTVMCHNNNNPEEMPSMIEGGRVKSGLSGSLDSVGWLAPQVKISRIGAIMSAGNSLHQEAAVKTPARTLTEDQSRQHRALMLIFFLQRRLPFLQRALALPVHLCPYGTAPFPDKIKMAVLQGTAGMRRFFLKNADNFARNFDGPFLTSTLFPMHFQMTLSRSVLRTCTLHTEGSLYASVVQTMTALKETLVGVLTTLGALYVWLFQCVLDMKPMVLSCFHLYHHGFNAPCPLEVLALAAQGHAMGAQELAQYEPFCAWLLKVLRGRQGAIVSTAGFEPLTEKTARTMFNFKQEGACEEIMQLVQQQQSTAVKSVYVSNCQGITTKKVPAAFIDRRDRSEEDFIDEYNSKPDDAIADLYAQEHDNRVDCREFWRAAAEGVRLPMQNDDNSDSRFEVRYDSVHRTGHFFQRTIEDMREGSGLLVSFLRMCGFGPKCTRYEVVSAILRPYLERHRVAFHLPDSPQWRAAILRLRGDGSFVAAEAPMRFVATPHVAMQANYSARPDGVNIDFVVDVLWLMVSTVYAKEWTPENEANGGVLVHTKNAAHQSLAMVNMLLHTSVDFAVIPAGRLLLPAPSATTAEDLATAELRLYPSLHKDSSCRRITKIEPGVEGADDEVHTKRVLGAKSYLSEARRHARKYQEVSVWNAHEGRAEAVLVHEDVMNNTHATPVSKLDDMMPYPVEALCSVRNYLPCMQRALTSMAQAGRPIDLFQALQEYGSNLDIDNCEEDMIMSRSVFPTMTALDADFGLPVFYYGGHTEHGPHPFMLGVVNRVAGQSGGDRYRLEGVRPTHARNFTNVDLTCEALPLNHVVEFGLSDMVRLVHGGLHLLAQMDNEREVYLHDIREPPAPGVKSLLGVAFPGCHWQQLVQVAADDSCLWTTEREMVRVLDVAQWLYDFRDSIRSVHDEVQVTTERTKRRWVDREYDSSLNEVLDSMLLVCLGRDADGSPDPFAEETRFVVVLQRDCNAPAGTAKWPTTEEDVATMREEYRFVVFNNEAHLLHEVRANAGSVMSEAEFDNWVWPEKAAMEELNINIFNANSYNLFRFHEVSGKVQSPVMRFFPPDQEALRKDVTEAERRISETEAKLSAERRVREQKKQANHNVAHHEEVIEQQEERLALFRDILAKRQSALRDAHAVVSIIRARVFEDPVLAPFLTPFDDLARDSTLGITKPWDSGRYMQAGHNLVHAVIDTEHTEMSFDFSIMSQCLVAEGTALYLMLNESVFSELRRVLPSATVPASMQQTLFASSEDEPVLALRVFYLLGSLYDGTPQTMHREAVRVVVTVHSRDRQYQHSICVRLWDEETNPVLLTERQRALRAADLPVVTVLDSTNKRPSGAARAFPVVMRDPLEDSLV